MRAGASRAFTLIELLLVICIVAVLMALLLPAVGAAQTAVMASDSRTRLELICSTIEQYSLQFDGVCPPSNRTGTWQYPIVKVPWNASPNTNNPPQYLIRQFDPNDTGPTYSTNYGHSLLTYFLMGPGGYGWSSEHHKVPRQWTPPDALRRIMTDYIVLHGRHTDINFTGSCRGYYAFRDAWGPNGTRSNVTGCYHYSVPYARGGYQRYDMYQAYYNGGTMDYQKGGDGPDGHIARLMKNAVGTRFVLVSAGADHKFGYYRWDESMKIYRADAANGVSDDIANVRVD